MLRNKDYAVIERRLCFERINSLLVSVCIATEQLPYQHKPIRNAYRITQRHNRCTFCYALRADDCIGN